MTSATAARVHAGYWTPSVLAPVLPPRACMLCTHGRGPEQARRCGHPEAADAPVDQVRRAGGACGPEAELLDFPGLRA